MAIKTYQPLTPSLRFTATPSFEELTKKTPEKSLTLPKKRTGGRNAQGRLTARHRGGGHKRRLRIVDWKRKRHGEVATVLGIEYDPNRSARLALLEYADKTRSYILAPLGLEVGSKVQSGPKAAPLVGNALPLAMIPPGQAIHNIELIPGRGAQLVRSAGVSATIMGVDNDYAQIRMPSGEIRRVHARCYATIGQVGNPSHEIRSLGKAGRARWLGRRPHVRGMAMNPIDHPNGGGNGKSKGGGGRQHPTSPWGQLAKGAKTRAKHKISNKFIIERRKKRK